MVNSLYVVSQLDDVVYMGALGPCLNQLFYLYTTYKP